jgi:catechol 2,3-dioxygenase-like lactoylglutathione lyase family enzyme
MQPRLSLITLGVADMPRARAFYEALGFTASSESRPTVTFFFLIRAASSSAYMAARNSPLMPPCPTARLDFLGWPWPTMSAVPPRLMR